MNHDDVRAEVKALIRVLIDLGNYTRDDLIDIVEDALESEGESQ